MPEELEGLLGVERDAQGARVREADVLGGEAHDAPRDVQRVLPRLEHPHEPVDRGVRDRTRASTCGAPR